MFSLSYIKLSEMRILLLFFVFSNFIIEINAQSEATLAIRSFRSENEIGWMKEYISFLSIPNIASDTIGMKQNANFIMDMMKKRNIQQVGLLNGVSKNIPPAIYGEVITPGATQTIIFYAHYDGQPVDSSQWHKGLSPFVPTLVNGSLEKGSNIIPFDNSKLNPDWRIYARGASDDKAGVMAILSAFEAINKIGFKLNYNVKFFFEGEEEAGSTHLSEIFQQNETLLQSDGWVICDGPVHQSGNKSIIFGVRGDAHLGITVYGPSRPLHSGHYGNWAPNPGLMLAKLLSSMKDEKGSVTIKGFYDDIKPLTSEEQKAVSTIPPVGDQMKKELKFLNEEMEGVSLEKSILMPSLNINGMQSGNVGKKASNVIPITATAVLDIRLVPGNDYHLQQQKVVDHIKSKGYYIINREPTNEERGKYAKIATINLSDGYNAQRTSLSDPFAKKIVAAVQSTTKEKLVLLPSMGGSLPLFLFDKYLKAKTITVPIANHDNNQHAENENIRIRNLWNGIETMAAIMMMK